MTTSDLWMKLETLAHLRGLPEYAAIRKSVQDEIAEYNNSLLPKAEEPRAAAKPPSKPIERSL